jgi:glucose-6-phosphate 1-dehydrogenase
MSATVRANSATETAPCNVMAILGGAGDLTRRKLFPALHHLWKEKLVSERFAAVGVGRDALTEAADWDMWDPAVREYHGAGFDTSVWFDASVGEGTLRSMQSIPGESADPPLWAGVPFYLRAGKPLPGRFTEVVIQYLQVPNFMFRDSLLERGNVPANSLVLRIWPNEDIGLNFNAKAPGSTAHLGAEYDRDFSCAEHFSVAPITGDETLLCDCLTGDATLFKRADSIEAAWALMEPVLDVWAAAPARDFPDDAAGTRGPAAADQLLDRDARLGRPCRFCQQAKP